MDIPQPTEQPVKVRKKPGRKPNPASPALRKAQNRAAQRAFRERKERHMRELEGAIKQAREQREMLDTENEQLRKDNEILKSENWYLKGIVLSLQLVCFQHHIVIPQHGPHLTKQTLSVLAQSIPETIGAYLTMNANSQQPATPSILRAQRQTDRYVTSGSIIITQDGIHTVPEPTAPAPAPASHHPQQRHPSPVELDDNLSQSSIPNLPALSPLSETHTHAMDEVKEFNNASEPFSFIPQPVKLEDPLSSNLAAIQTLRLRLRLQSACIRTQSSHFAIQPTLLQLTVPHDPRIDLIPTPHMRDRMILFKDQFDLDDCFRCLLAGSVFHGGDPATAGNWQLPPEFFDKYWFLTIDYDLRRTTNRWRRMQGLDELKDFREDTRAQSEMVGATMDPALADLASLLNVDFTTMPAVCSSSISSQSTASTAIHPTENVPTHTPVPLTNGYTGYPEMSSTAAQSSNSPFERWESFMMGKDNDMNIDDLVDLNLPVQQ
ncbi:hypothetical protein DFQ28_000722 [Apophysomyces sp. BC1034]|nr:hypothetical protein DFQ29_010113 [Apophysomyces sp. BC1021]KAG0191229.1 hypothetical protein DFQ28_000722 [Apophysomyces sp. BC1034]